MGLISKRYKDIFEQYIYKGQKTPFSIGTFAVCAFCFLLLIVATFSETSLPIVNIDYNNFEGFSFSIKDVSYNPRIPALIFIIYLLGKNFSLFVFFIYLITGLFFWPIFVFGKGFDCLQNYLFGYFLGFIFAIFIMGTMLSKNQDIKTRLISGTLGVLVIHLSGFVYCAILAVFRLIDFNMIIPIAHTISENKIIYDLLFSHIVLLIGPYIKNIFWICMKPKPDKKSKGEHQRIFNKEDYNL